MILKKILKYIGLNMLLLFVLCFISTLVMKLMDIIFSVNYENIWPIGFEVGFVSWLILFVIWVIKKMKNNS